MPDLGGDGRILRREKIKRKWPNVVDGRILVDDSNIGVVDDVVGVGGGALDGVQSVDGMRIVSCC